MAGTCTAHMQGPEVAGPRVGRQYGILWSLNPSGVFRRGSEGPMLGHVDMEGDYLLPQQLDLNQEHLCSFPNGPMTLPNFLNYNPQVPGMI